MLPKFKFIEHMTDYIAANATVTCADAMNEAEKALRFFMNQNGFRYGNPDFHWDENGAYMIAADWVKRVLR